MDSQPRELKEWVSNKLMTLLGYSKSVVVQYVIRLAKECSSTGDLVGKLVEFGFTSSAETRSFAADIYAKVPRRGSGISNYQKQEREAAQLVWKQSTYKLLADDDDNDAENQTSAGPQSAGKQSSKSRKHFRKKAEDQDGGDDDDDDDDEKGAKDSGRNVRRRTEEEDEEEDGHDSSDDEQERIREQQEGAQLERNMKERDAANTRKLMERQLSKEDQEELNRRSQAIDKNDTSDLSAATKKANVTQDEMDSQEDDLSPVYNPHSVGENNSWFAPDSPSTLQKRIEYTRKAHMTRASHALKYYYTSHPGECYNPEHVNLKHVIFMMDTKGFYIHMNFTARNVKDGAEKIFFAELRLPYAHPAKEWVVTACDIVGPESLGGLRHVWCPNGIRFTVDTKDVKNCYACYDYIKHIDGSMYEAGHSGHGAYEISDISVE